jgi:hypothetical protein
MKKYLLTLCCFYSLTGFSQDLNKGDKLFGGSISFTTYNYNSNVYNSSGGSNAGIAPSFSWLIKNNLALGIRGGVGYSTSKAENQTGPANKNTNLNAGAGVFLKKYKSLKDKFGLYFDNEVSFNFISNKQKGGIPLTIIKNETKGIGYEFSPGVFYKFSNHFMGEANIGGAYATYNKGGGSNNFSAGLSLLQYFNLGINYRIEGKKKS